MPVRARARRPRPSPILSLTEELGILIVRLGGMPVGAITGLGASAHHTSEWRWKTYRTGQVPDREEAIALAFGGAWSITEWTGRFWAWSRAAFGPGPLTESLAARIRASLKALEDGPPEPDHWLAIVTLALDGYGRCGGNARTLIETLDAQQAERVTQESPS